MKPRCTAKCRPSVATSTTRPIIRGSSLWSTRIDEPADFIDANLTETDFLQAACRSRDVFEYVLLVGIARLQRAAFQMVCQGDRLAAHLDHAQDAANPAIL